MRRHQDPGQFRRGLEASFLLLTIPCRALLWREVFAMRIPVVSATNTSSLVDRCCQRSKSLKRFRAARHPLLEPYVVPAVACRTVTEGEEQ